MSLDISKMRGEQKRLASGGAFGQSLVLMPPGKGVVLVRLLSRPGTDLFQRTRVHNVNGRNLHCPRELGEDQFWKGSCPICEYYSLLWKNLKNKTPDEQERDKATARAIKPVERYYYNVIVRNETDQESGEVRTNVGPKILAVGKTLHEIVIEGIVGSMDSDEHCDVTDPVAGKDLKIVKNIKKGSDMEYPDYAKSKFEGSSPLGTPEEVEKWLANLHNLADLRKVQPYNELLHQLRVHFGLEKDNSIGFDISEFNKVTGGNGAASEAKVVKTEEPVEDNEAVTPAADDQLADDDFVKDLNDL